jgi:hypothetical protein
LERKGLEHGLKFAVVHNRIPTAEIIASVEEGIFPLDDDAKRLVRAEVSSILRCAKIPPKLYLLLKKIRTGLFFQRTKAIVCLKSDWKDSKRFKFTVSSFEEIQYYQQGYI